MDNLQSLIENYIQAANAQDGERVARCFLENATVHDEGHVHHGRDEIAAWARQSAAQYGAVIEPLDIVDDGGRTTMRAKVSGSFPSSPAVLAFHFVLQADGIASLEVTP